MESTGYIGPYAPSYVPVVKKARKASKKYTLAAKYQKRSLLSKEINMAQNGPEKKFIDVSNTITVTNVGQISLLNGCIPGTDAVNRIGRKTVMKSLTFDCVAVASAALTVAGAVRVHIVYDKQPNGALPNATTIFKTDDWLGHNNLDNRDRFVTLVDDILPVGNQSGSQNVTVCRKHVKLQGKDGTKGLPCIFNNGSAGTAADFTTGTIVLMITGGNFITNFPLFYFNSRVRFMDD